MEYSNWFKEKLSDVIEYILDYRGKTPKKSIYGIPTLSAKSVKDNWIDYSEVYYISEQEYARFMTKGFPQKGDILLTMEAPLGLVCLLDRDDVGLGQRIVTIRGKKEKIDNRFLKYYLQSPIGQNQLYSRATGTTVIGISQKNLLDIEVLTPTLEEQNKIANILSSFDNKIENNNAIIANLEAQAQAIFKSWFIDFEPFQNGKFVDSELGEIPVGWGICSLKDLSKRRNGYTYKSVELLEESNINMLNLKSFNRNGGINFNDIKPIMRSERMKEFHYLKENDILIACTDLTQNAEVIGRTISYFSNPKFESEIFSMDLIKIEPMEESDRLFLYSYLSSPLFKEYAESVVTGTTVLHLPKKEVDNFKIIYPDEKIIEKFSNIIEPINLMIRKLIYQNQTLASLSDTLLPKLMSGEIRVG